MEKFKIDNFKNSNPGKFFPKFRPLTSSEASNLVEKFAKIIDKAEGNQLHLTIDKLQQTIDRLDAKEDSFRFNDVLCELHIETCPTIYINWDQYKTIDAMLIDDFCSFFNDIWYPSSDDIDIFDDSTSWIISVTHYGAVKYIKFMNYHCASKHV